MSGLGPRPGRTKEDQRGPKWTKEENTSVLGRQGCSVSELFGTGAAVYTLSSTVQSQGCADRHGFFWPDGWCRSSRRAAGN